MKLKNTGIEHYFEFVVTAEEVGVGKPDRKIFEETCKRANLPTEKITYIGDNLKKDALAAADVGMNGVWLNRKGLSAPQDVPQIQSLLDWSLNMI